MQTHIQELCEHLESKDVISLVLIAKENGDFLLKLGGTDSHDSIFFSRDFFCSSLFDYLKTIGIGLVHFHHVIGISKNILKFSDILKCKQVVTYHDYFIICGNPTLTDKNGQYTEDEKRWGDNPIFGRLESDIIENYRNLVDKNSLNIFTSESVFRIIKNHFDVKNPVIAPHIETNRPPRINIFI